ncbi:hypothetical protein LARI1_G009572 [Lachnellula arida]|uniref:Ribosome biogenesis protein SLX9 n=1 Tax=Lachnellula arida TaxID=1316785 RepID=A0A8T9AYS7_9HELO|nr:hypothetical protein LARI1_G009572 [Lachnellula arida]
MAPTAPKKRPSMRSKASASSRPSSSSSNPQSGSGLITRPTPTPSLSSNSKKDKRVIKSSLFKHRIEKAHPTPATKRRRPSKKLVSNLDALADALPDIEGMGMGKVGGGKIKMDSLTSGKGLMRRRGKVEGVERERFGRNLGLLMGGMSTGVSPGPSIPTAPLMGGQGQTAQLQPQPSATAKRFQALRAWIGETMEKDGAFEGK